VGASGLPEGLKTPIEKSVICAPTATMPVMEQGLKKGVSIK
jgi:hypothetical protein